ncbi:uncharacterized protein FMAN_06447 [Fusarium mangiferae]|uniref:DUF6604 domain-containing protein n=1 Tax=Fusarium mangiferae TaxID=192010 RepID=A0A1L7SQU8_FUSMA|nr:uncharacterized protein FMAN_06447 [Fusarium mangiferae]CVK86194.1 uncharacterized protein FMAN_06447 [Fusarium mangiferae]
MLPPALVSVYREYKKDTNSIASWLASAAKECEYPADLLSNSPDPKQPAPRLRGKTRAEAKKKAKVTPQESTPQNEGPRYIIEIKDFVPLAECISAYKKPALSVPRTFFSTLNRVIEARTGFSSELDASNQKQGDKSDARHSYFVGILENVREVLEPYSDPAVSGSSKEAETLTNKFKELKVYHPSEKFLNAKDIERPGPANNDDVIYEADAGDSADEAFFCIQAADGGDSLDPSVVAVVTNTAIEFGLALAEDAKPLFEKHGGIGAMVEQLLSGFLIDQEVDMSKFREQVAKGSVDEKVYTVMSHCCFKHAFRSRPSPKFRGGDWEDKSMSQKLTEEQVIIAELWTEAMALVYQVPDYPFSDEFIRGVKEFKETK